MRWKFIATAAYDVYAANFNDQLNIYAGDGDDTDQLLVQHRSDEYLWSGRK